MDATSVAAFEQRATAAEARLAALESRVAGGAGASAASTQELTQLREVLVAAREETLKLEQERNQACERQKALEDENSRLRYQILHLKRAVAEGDAKLAEAASKA